MKRSILIGSVAVFMSLSTAGVMAPVNAWADSAVTTSSGETDAGALINKKVVDGSGATVGSVDSVLVDSSGKVTSVVVDVSNWLESKKLVSVPWSDIKVDPKGTITTSMTKDAARQQVAYEYKDQTLRGRVLNENNELYTPSTNATDAQNGNATVTPSDNSTQADNSGIKNADGSLNASEIIGLKVKNGQDQDVGKISEVLLGSNGKANGVIVDVGGFLGVATHPVRLSWKDIKLHEDGSNTFASVAMSKDQLKQLPEAKR